MTKTVLTLARFSLLEAIRTRIGWLALALLGISALLAWLLGQVAITETHQIQMVMTASFLRFSAVFLIAVFVAIAQTREASDKGVDMLLSLPTPRTAYYLGKLTGYVASAWVLAIAFGLPLLFVQPDIGTFVWTASLGLELSIIAAASLFFITTLIQAPAALAATIGFYLLSRSISAFQLIGGSQILDDGSITPKLIEWILEGISMLLPRLDLFTQSAWFAQPPGSIEFLASLAGQALGYVALLSAAGMIDLHRKNF